MRLLSLKVKNFRGYRNETIVRFNDLTALIGANDVGKSTILEALAVFFDSPNVKLEKSDLNVNASRDGDNTIEITCAFSEFPETIVIDAQAQTSLRDEHLLNDEGNLEIKKVFNCALATPKEQVYIVASHPNVNRGSDLLLLKRTELRNRANELGIENGTFNANTNSSIRSAIWRHLGDLELATQTIQVDKEDAKQIWSELSKVLPYFALFKVDRESSDSDKEVTDPMKVAIAAAITELQPRLSEIQDSVREKACDVARRTLAKLQAFNANLANELTPSFKSDPKWASLFSLTLSGDNSIPINKRGSGVRRLIVLSFFQAEAERRQAEDGNSSIIYAFEEPENSQHPNHQAMLIQAFQRLSESTNTQVFLTTHNPAIAGLIDQDDLRLVRIDANDRIIVDHGGADMMRRIKETLGMLPNPLTAKLMLCVEGPNDVEFFRNISATIHQVRNDLPDLSNEEKVALFPLGGSTLKQWVDQDYLSNMNIRQYHIYDLDDPVAPRYQAQVDLIRARGNGDWADLTVKRETENYICPNCTSVVYGGIAMPAFGEMDDVPEIVASLVHAASDSPTLWADLDDEKREKKINQAKKRLNSEVTKLMTFEQIQAADPDGDLIRWLQYVSQQIQ